MSFSEIQRLRQDLSRSDPRDPRAQAELLSRIRELRDLLEGSAADDLVGYLDAAEMLTSYLCQMAGIGPEEIQAMAGRLLGNVERAFGGPAPPPAPEAVHAAPPPFPSGGGPLGGSLRLANAEPAGTLRLASDLFLGEVLIQLGFCDAAAVERGLLVQRATGKRIGEALVELGAVSWAQVDHAVRVQGGMRHTTAGDLRR